MLPLHSRRLRWLFAFPFSLMSANQFNIRGLIWVCVFWTWCLKEGLIPTGQKAISEHRSKFGLVQNWNGNAVLMDFVYKFTNADSTGYSLSDSCSSDDSSSNGCSPRDVDSRFTPFSSATVSISYSDYLQIMYNCRARWVYQFLSMFSGHRSLERGHVHRSKPYQFLEQPRRAFIFLRTKPWTSQRAPGAPF